MKKLLLFSVALMLALSLTACEVNTGGGGTTAQPQSNGIQPPTDTTAPPTQPAASSADRQEIQAVPAIVFDDTVEDPFVAAVGSLPGVEGSAALKLTLFETSPGVYSGDGTLERNTKMAVADNTTISTFYYKLSFQELRAGQSSGYTVPMFNLTDQSSVFDTGLSVYNTYIRAAQFMPAEILLTVDGDTARLTGFNCEFSGNVTQTPPVKPDTGRLAGRCISVNGTFYETGKSYNHEYRALLTATADRGEYAGDFFVYGSEDGFPLVDKAVRFTLQPFDRKAYTDAGGSLAGSFDAFGVIEAPGGNYIVLIDGERPLIENVNRDMIFYGSLIPEAQANEAKRIANETKQLTRTLYDGTDKTKVSAGGTAPAFWHGTPTWYPEWLIPGLPGSDGWGWYEMLNEQGYNRYRMQLDSEDPFDAVLDFYARQLAGYENFDLADPGDRYASICFSKGIYNIMIVIMLGSPIDVVIYIT